MVLQHARPPANGGAGAEHAGPSSSRDNPHSKTIVIKLGTSSILDESTFTPRLSILSSLVETCHALRHAGHKVLLVCSGAIGMGRVKMNMGQSGPPKTLGERQALAAIGQSRLMALWDSLFSQLGIGVAQVLLTKHDIADRARYRNARTTLLTLLHQLDCIPIVNENDTVSVSELRFGDNDTLSAITAALVDAHFLFLCTDVDGLYTGNPRTDPDARRLGAVHSVGAARKAVHVSSMGSNFGTGGMQTKLIAADLATAAGVATVILNGNTPGNIIKIVEAALPPAESAEPVTVSTQHATPLVASAVAKALAGTATPSTEPPGTPTIPPNMTSSISSLASEDLHKVGYPPLNDPPHTIFLPFADPLPSRKWSILHALHPSGSLIMDEGAYKAIRRTDSGGRLLPAGVVGVEGNWERMQAVRLMVRRRRQSQKDSEATQEAATSADEWEVIEVGRGLANYTLHRVRADKGIEELANFGRPWLR